MLQLTSGMTVWDHVCMCVCVCVCVCVLVVVDTLNTCSEMNVHLYDDSPEYFMKLSICNLMHVTAIL